MYLYRSFSARRSVNIPHSFLHNVLVSYSLLLFLGLNIFGGTLHCLNNCYDNLHNFFQALEKLVWEKIRPTFSVTIGLGSNGLKSFSINLNNNYFSPFQFNVLFYCFYFFVYLLFWPIVKLAGSASLTRQPHSSLCLVNFWTKDHRRPDNGVGFLSPEERQVNTYKRIQCDQTWFSVRKI